MTPPPAAPALKSVFGKALEIDSPADRAAYLDAACGSDAALRAEVEALLAALDRADGFLEPPEAAATLGTPAPAAADPDATATAPGDLSSPSPLIAGRYKPLECLGEGGMGTVHVAEQVHPVRRKVALKLIKPGMDSRQVLARFEAERQALALMDHPNIAKVLDGGLTDDGRPFFVMEYLKGVPITDYCDEARLTVRERLALFVPVCQAVQHAHQKGVIHRDLKPSNILVALYDGKAVPKVIDFGLAKAIHQPLTDRTIHTAHEAVLGTPLYMAPEQAILNNVDVDTRADVYALGVVLYELLTGTTPLDRARFKQAAWDEVLRLIREEEPSKPSTKLSTLEALPSVAANRQVEPARLSTLVRGDLDWIAMKALEKDRSRRYETANGLARDIERFLRDDPVEAGPPSASYRLRKYARKHRAALTTAAAFAALLLAATVVSSLLAAAAVRSSRRAEREAGRARQAEALAQSRLSEVERANAATTRALADTDAALKQSERSREQAVAVSRFLVESFRKPDPAQDGRELKVADLLDGAAARLGDDFAGPPAIRGELLDALGRTYLGLGLYDRAVECHERARDVRGAALGPDHPDTLVSRNNLAMAYLLAGRTADAIALGEVTLPLATAKLGPDHPDTLVSRNNLAEAYRLGGRWAEAIELGEVTLPLAKAKLGDDHPDTLVSRGNLTTAYLNAWRTAEAIELGEETLRLQTAKLGADHPRTLASRNNLAFAYRRAGRTAEAIALDEVTLRLVRDKLGADHPDTLSSRLNLAVGYRDTGQLDRALPLLEETLELASAKMGPDHPFTLASMNNLAKVYLADKQHDRALRLFEETFALMKARLGPDHPGTLTCMNDRAVGYQAAGHLDRALPLLEETLKLRRARLAPGHPDILVSLRNLASGYRAAERLDEALPLYREAATGVEARRFLVPNAGQFLDDLVGVLEQLKRFDEAEAWRRKWLAALKERARADSPEYAAELSALGANLLRREKWAEAEPVLREGLAILEKTGPDDWATFHTRSLLGGGLLDLGKHAEAEPLLIQGYEGMKAREAKIPESGKPRLPEAAARILRLYESWDKPEKAAEWREKLGDDRVAPKPADRP